MDKYLLYIWICLFKNIFRFLNNVINLNMIPSIVTFDNIFKLIIVKSLWLWPISDLLPPDLHWTKDTYALFSKIFYLPLTELHSKNLLLVIQLNDNPGLIPFQSLVIDLVNNIELYYVLNPMDRVVFDHESKAWHIIDHLYWFKV